jgi:hypothetical protein
MRLSRVLSLVLLVAAGCASRSGLVPVEGQVVHSDDGSPATELKGYTVEFQSIDGRLDGKPASATGEIDAEGKFRLSTLKANDGALAGRHKVILAPASAAASSKTKRVIDKKYESFDTSGLEATVAAGTPVTVTVDRAKK